ncbi:hypothetical protein BH10PSE16_BH10PSE16_28560 [soil metagenome]
MDPTNLNCCLASILGLRPLDRVLINSRHEIGEARAFSKFADQPFELPWFYFQRVIGQQFEVRSPGGYATLISPLDVCDVLPGTPIAVKAITPAAFVARLSLSPAERNAGAGPPDFAEAHVLFAEKDKWGRATFCVWFTDERHNGKHPWRATLPGADAGQCARLARRTVMPVISRSGASHSADHGTAQAAALDARVATLFIGSALRGDASSASRLACAGVRPIPLARLNRDFGQGLESSRHAPAAQ